MDKPAEGGDVDESSVSTLRDKIVIQHNRQRAKPPMLPQTEAALKRTGPVPDPSQVPTLSREQVSKAYDILEERRLGPWVVKYGTLGSVGLIAFTYLQGFYHLAQKNREAWVGTFRHRTLILGPLIAMYATANDVIPLPYKDRVEAALGRNAITMLDIVTAQKTVQKAQDLPLSAQA